MERKALRFENSLMWVVILLAVFGLGAIGYRLMSEGGQKTPVSIGSKTYYTQVATTDEQRTIGLGETPSLGESDGLLMVFSTDDNWRIWMKDMKYPIDIVWIDKSKRIVDVRRNVDPETYKDGKSFGPKKDARYVLEVAAGSTQRYGIKVGDVVKFNTAEFE